MHRPHLHQKRRGSRQKTRHDPGGVGQDFGEGAGSGGQDPGTRRTAQRRRTKHENPRNVRNQRPQKARGLRGENQRFDDEPQVHGDPSCGRRARSRQAAEGVGCAGGGAQRVEGEVPGNLRRGGADLQRNGRILSVARIVICPLLLFLILFFRLLLLLLRIRSSCLLFYVLFLVFLCFCLIVASERLSVSRLVVRSFGRSVVRSVGRSVRRSVGRSVGRLV